MAGRGAEYGYTSRFVIGCLVPFGSVELKEFDARYDAMAFYRQQMPFAAKIFFHESALELDEWIEEQKYGLPEPLRQIRLKFSEYKQHRRLFRTFVSEMRSKDMSRQLFPRGNQEEVACAILPGDQLFYCIPNIPHLKLTHHAIYVGKFILDRDGMLKFDQNGEHRVVEVFREGLVAKIVLKTLQVFRTRETKYCSPVRLRYYRERARPRFQSVRVALEHVGKSFTWTGFKNCESFVFFCIMMNSRSFQVEEVFKKLDNFKKLVPLFSAISVCSRALTATGKTGNQLYGGAKMMRALKVAGNGARATNGIRNIVSGLGGLGGTLIAEQVLGDGTDAQNTAIQVGGSLGGAAGGIASTTLVSVCAAEGAFGGAVVTSGLASLGVTMVGGLAVCTGIGAVAAIGGAALAVGAKNAISSKMEQDNSSISRGLDNSNFSLDFDMRSAEDAIAVHSYGEVVAFFLPFERPQEPTQSPPTHEKETRSSDGHHHLSKFFDVLTPEERESFSVLWRLPVRSKAVEVKQQQGTTPNETK